MLIRKSRYLSLFGALFLALLSVTGVWAVTVGPWDWAGVITNVSSSGDVQADVSISTDEEEVAVVWAGGQALPGIFLAHFTQWGWERSAITLTGSKANRFPDVLFLGICQRLTQKDGRRRTTHTLLQASDCNSCEDMQRGLGG